MPSCSSFPLRIHSNSQTSCRVYTRQLVGGPKLSRITQHLFKQASRESGVGPTVFYTRPTTVAFELLISQLIKGSKEKFFIKPNFRQKYQTSSSGQKFFGKKCYLYTIFELFISMTGRSCHKTFHGVEKRDCSSSNRLLPVAN